MQYQRIVRFVICEEYSDVANVCVKVCMCSDCRWLPYFTAIVPVSQKEPIRFSVTF